MAEDKTSLLARLAILKDMYLGESYRPSLVQTKLQTKIELDLQEAICDLEDGELALCLIDPSEVIRDIAKEEWAIRKEGKVSRGARQIESTRRYLELIGTDRRAILKGTAEYAILRMIEWVKHVDDKELLLYMIDPLESLREEAKRVYESRRQQVEEKKSDD